MKTKDKIEAKDSPKTEDVALDVPRLVLPIPAPSYPCMNCSDDYSWPSGDLWWSDREKNWVCAICWDERDCFYDDDGEPLESEPKGISLAEEIISQIPCKCECGEDSTGWVNINCCNICGLPHEDEKLNWKFQHKNFSR